jgi:hypothetical protein
LSGSSTKKKNEKYTNVGVYFTKEQLSAVKTTNSTVQFVSMHNENNFKWRGST